METQTAAQHYQVPVERRNNLLLRGHYDAALLLIEPVLTNMEVPIGTRLFQAMNQLQASYPSLKGHEIEALVAAVMRTLQKRHKAVS